MPLGVPKLGCASCKPLRCCQTGSLADGKGQTGRLHVTLGVIMAETSKCLVGHITGDTWKVVIT